MVVAAGTIASSQLSARDMNLLAASWSWQSTCDTGTTSRAHCADHWTGKNYDTKTCAMCNAQMAGGSHLSSRLHNYRERFAMHFHPSLFLSVFCCCIFIIYYCGIWLVSVLRNTAMTIGSWPAHRTKRVETQMNCHARCTASMWSVEAREEKKTTKIEMNGTNHLKWAIKLLFLRGIFICWMDQMVCLFSLLMSPCICVCTCRGRRRWQRPRTALWENEACKMRSSSVTWMKRSYGTDDDVGPQHNESTIYWAGERWMHDWDRTVQRLSHCDGINPLLVWIFSFRNGHIRASLDRFV